MTASVSTTTRRMRSDIQALRGYAVLLVLLYHARLGVPNIGFLGVDVFFVISGFLMTRLVGDAISQQAFSIPAFYLRRAKRLLPAAYATIMVTACAAPLLLTAVELRDFRVQALGALTFTANVVLWRQTGYFGGAADLKPLLHMWSLAVEEQYYLVLPFLMLYLPRRYWRHTLALAIVGSLALWRWRYDQASTFYLLPARAWELGLGSIGALLSRDVQNHVLVRFAFWPSLMLLVAVPFVPDFLQHPARAVFIICIATLTVLLRAHDGVSAWRHTRALARVGDMSYSLYLVHWPLFAFMNNVWISEAWQPRPRWQAFTLVGASLLLGYLLHRYVEAPMHRAELPTRRRALALVAASSAGVALLVVALTGVPAGTRDFADIRRINHGFGPACEAETEFVPTPNCRSSDRPQLLVWGDSYAMALVPGIVATDSAQTGVVQATRSMCAPLLDYAVVRDSVYDRTWAMRCIDFNASVLRYVASTSSIEYVVLSSLFHQVANDADRLLVRRASGGYDTVDAGQTEAINGMRHTVQALRALGRKVIVIAPPPASGFNMGRCLERLETGKPILGAPRGCAIDAAEFRSARQAVRSLMTALPNLADVEVLQPESVLCDTVLCRTHAGGTFIYRDAGHLSREGSVYLARIMSLNTRIRAAAR